MYKLRIPSHYFSGRCVMGTRLVLSKNKPFLSTFHIGVMVYATLDSIFSLSIHCLSLPAANPSITNPLVFNPGSSSSTLTCTSTTSVATTVTFMRDSTTVGPLRDGESMGFDGVTYQLAQTVTNRAQSTYQNVLTINQPLADIIGSTFTCSVENRIGTSPVSQPLTITMGELLLFEH